MRRKPTGVKVIQQRKDFDCGVASMAMLMNVTYGDVSAVCRALYGSTKPNKRGLLLYHMEEIADQLGTRLKRVYRGNDYMVGKSGILGMNGGQMDSAGHWVVLQNGNTVIDPDGGDVWTLDDYVKKYKCRPATLLTKED